MSKETQIPTKKAKPSGNRYKKGDLPPYIVHVQSADNSGPSPHPLAISRIISNTQYSNSIKLIKKIGRTKLSVEFATLKAADFVDNPALREKTFTANIPTFRVIRAGIIWDVPIDFEPEELIASIDAPVKVLSATRLNRKIFREQESHPDLFSSNSKGRSSPTRYQFSKCGIRSSLLFQKYRYVSHVIGLDTLVRNVAVGLVAAVAGVLNTLMRTNAVRHPSPPPALTVGENISQPTHHVPNSISRNASKPWPLKKTSLFWRLNHA